MDLFEYIKSQLPQMPNSAIMKQMGASKELIDYVKETPWNTNLNILNSLIFNNIKSKIWFEGEITFSKNKYGDYSSVQEFELSEEVDIDNLPEKITILLNERTIELSKQSGSGISYNNLPFSLGMNIQTGLYHMGWDKEESGHLIIQEN